jgi:hypothetical protein
MSTRPVTVPTAFLGLLLLGAIAPVHAVLHAGEETAPPAESSPEEKEIPRVLFKEDFNARTRQAGRFLANRYIALAEKAGRDGSDAIRVTYAGYERGSQRVVVRLPMSAKARAATLSFDVKFEKGFDFVLGGKLHGIGPARPITGGATRLPAGWSARAMFKKQGRIATYLYDQNKDKKWGIGHTTEKPVFTPGEWQAVALKVTLNAPGRADGSTRVLVDGNEVLHTGNVEFRGKGGAETLIQTFLFSTFHGGHKPRHAPRGEDGKYRKVYALFDNFLVVEGAN